MNILKGKWVWFALGALLATVAIFAWSSAHAADLGGGNCCADLEERIAELEATAAKKGTRKVSLTVSGQINKAIIWYDTPLGSDTAVIEGGASETFFGFRGEAVLRPDWKAGYVLTVGQGVTGLDFSGSITVDNDVYLRESFVFLSTPAGKVSIGHQKMATYGVSTIQLGNTDASTKLLTIQPVTAIVGFNAEIFNGIYADAVRYDSGDLAGFGVSASWATAGEAKDVALRYAGEAAGFRLAAGIGYLDLEDTSLLGLGDVEKLMGSAAVQHIGTGLFLNAAYAKLDTEFVDTDAFHIQSGIARNWFEIGDTTIFAEYADWSDVELSFYGIGLNQNIGAIDLYLTGRQYDIYDEDVTTVTGGMRLSF